MIDSPQLPGGDPGISHQSTTRGSIQRSHVMRLDLDCIDGEPKFCQFVHKLQEVFNILATEETLVIVISETMLEAKVGHVGFAYFDRVPFQ